GRVEQCEVAHRAGRGGSIHERSIERRFGGHGGERCLALTARSSGGCRLVCARLALWLLGQDRFDIALSGRELRLPRHAIDGLQRFDFTIGSHTELRELASTREDLSLERSDCAVEGVDGVAEAASEPAQVSREDGQSTIEILAERSDRLGVLSERELAPTVRDRLQQGDEARRRCDDDVLANRVLEKSGVLGESRGQELIARYEK